MVTCKPTCRLSLLTDGGGLTILAQDTEFLKPCVLNMFLAFFVMASAKGLLTGYGGTVGRVCRFLMEQLQAGKLKIAANEKRGIGFVQRKFFPGISNQDPGVSNQDNRWS